MFTLPKVVPGCMHWTIRLLTWAPLSWYQLGPFTRKTILRVNEVKLFPHFYYNNTQQSQVKWIIIWMKSTYIFIIPWHKSKQRMKIKSNCFYCYVLLAKFDINKNTLSPEPNISMTFLNKFDFLNIIKILVPHGLRYPFE